ncbi:MAG: PQQ-binding-like beta-propeller repeat protein [Halobacteriales archaeon]|nr:PQQ-binding-like beta-propeller repeat protein [Halobacteriales archaeon]
MERRRAVLLGLALAVLLAVGGAASVVLLPSGPTLAETWVSDPPEGASGNHHGPAVGTVDGRPLVFAPVSAGREGPACGLVALDAADGTEVWTHPVPPADCTVHAVADPTVADRDGTLSVLVATTENAVFDLDPATGEVRERYALTSYGYTPPQVVDLLPGGGTELLIADAQGTVQLIAANGTVRWEQSFGAFVWARPIVADVSGGGGLQVAVGTSDGRLLVLDRTGGIVRDVAEPFNGSITWLAGGQLDEDPALELVAATTSGQVVAVDGATGEVQWTRHLGRFASVAAVADGNADGTNEVFVAAADGVVRGLEGATGRTEWAREVATSPVQMMPPPVVGDVTGDAQDDLVVASNDGRVVALNPASGSILAEYTRETTAFEKPTLADVDGDRELEVFVMYSDGAVVRLDYEEPG